MLAGTGVNGTVDRRIQGDFGSSVAVNSQGIEILSSARPIALPDWLVIAVLPTTEAFAPVRDMQQRIMWMSLVAMHSPSSNCWSSPATASRLNKA
jgi:hypothetical protein